MYLNNRTWEVKLDYENAITEQVKLQAGYQGTFSHENTPQESYIDETSWDGSNATMDEAYYNRFIYNMDLHAAYATATMKFGKLGVMAGLRGEYWKVNTESYTWAQENDATLRDKPFKKDYFQLFPSVFLSYQLTDNDQFQLNYTPPTPSVGRTAQQLPRHARRHNGELRKPGTDTRLLQFVLVQLPAHMD